MKSAKIVGGIAAIITLGSHLSAIGQTNPAPLSSPVQNQNAFANEVDAAVKRATELVKIAKDPAELDPALNELLRLASELQKRRGQPEYASRGNLYSTINFLRTWQDFVAAEQGGYREEAIRALKETDRVSSSPLLPRSEILARQHKYWRTRTREEIEAILGKVKMIDDMGKAIRELQDLDEQTRPPSNSSSDNLRANLIALGAIEKVYDEFKAGLPVKLEELSPSSTDPNPITPCIFPVKVQLLRLILPRYLGLPADISPKPHEEVVPFLDRVVQEARNRGDGALILRARDARASLQTRGTVASTLQAGMISFQAAQNQEEAGQFQLAVASYQEALQSGSDTVPAKMIGEKLGAIKARHKEEYEKGMLEFRARHVFGRRGSAPPGVSPNALPAFSPSVPPLSTALPSGKISPTPSPLAH